MLDLHLTGPQKVAAKHPNAPSAQISHFVVVNSRDIVALITFGAVFAYIVCQYVFVEERMVPSDPYQALLK